MLRTKVGAFACVLIVVAALGITNWNRMRRVWMRRSRPPLEQVCGLARTGMSLSEVESVLRNWAPESQVSHCERCPNQDPNDTISLFIWDDGHCVVISNMDGRVKNGYPSAPPITY